MVKVHENNMPKRQRKSILELLTGATADDLRDDVAVVDSSTKSVQVEPTKSQEHTHVIKEHVETTTTPSQPQPMQTTDNQSNSATQPSPGVPAPEGMQQAQQDTSTTVVEDTTTVIRHDFTPESQAPQKQEDEHWLENRSGEAVGAEGQLTIDVYEMNDIIVIKSTIAGVKPEDLDVNINNDMVTIKGERKKDETVPETAYFYQELYWGTFTRSVILPSEVQHDKIEASMKNGILTVRLPKKEEARNKKITVKGF